MASPSDSLAPSETKPLSIRQRQPAFLFVNHRLEGNAPSTIEAVVQGIRARSADSRAEWVSSGGPPCDWRWCSTSASQRSDRPKVPDNLTFRESLLGPIHLASVSRQPTKKFKHAPVETFHVKMPVLPRPQYRWRQVMRACARRLDFFKLAELHQREPAMCD
jgi:hypothetical protein